MGGVPVSGKTCLVEKDRKASEKLTQALFLENE